MNDISLIYWVSPEDEFNLVESIGHLVDEGDFYVLFNHVVIDEDGSGYGVSVQTIPKSTVTSVVKLEYSVGLTVIEGGKS